ncbi:MAG TPA: RdgB/HAM1 family non-canonical purine NTP pyrophosphatase [Gammaproteobacteria bacterium]
MKKIVLASGNKGKVREFNEMLGGLHFEVAPQGEFAVPEIEETGLSFVENAILKARNAAMHTGLPALADDSGLEVDALQGAPGIYSARYCGPDSSDAKNVDKLLAALAQVPEAERTARFQCLIVYMRHPSDPTPIIAQGSWEGRIAFARSGSGGFGYDPVFIVPELGRSVAELTAEEKNARSHRGQALRHLLASLSLHS